ncbi:Rpn family recombination-promoting nuclease/putative transposase [Chroococcus sp. FPU101]|uniref:Rpn family recombination-promoting nuclease/putative transposase n=1 Tax=Chroococcus sp. FPU101 TaxID=1974212 RepID=UPI001A8D5D2A|nr:Rpn family recombination-promoting nuclease/putative transposase [Chroococcus sp. FPU101]GFE69933.1 hypothetical protein CFPU101_25430 [Chroococcus sp. FPU101]
MKTDAIFYQLFQEFPQIFFEIINQPNIPSHIYQFIAPEVKQRSFRLDGIFSPPEDASQYPLYFVEVQFYREEDFYDRLFSSIFLYFGQYRPTNPEWLAIVIFDLTSNDVEIPSRYQALVSRHLQIIYLDQVGAIEEISLGLAIVKLIVQSPIVASQTAPNLLERVNTEITDLPLSRQIIDVIETIIVYKFPQLSSQEIAEMLNLEGIKQTRFYQETFEEGKEEGREEGRLEKQIEMIPLLHELGLNAEQIAERLKLDLNLVRQHLQP